MKKKISKAIVIIHFQPLELYPPICNLLDYLSTSGENKIVVITTKNKKAKKLEPYENASEHVVIRRSPAIVSTSSARLLRYLFFYLNSLRLFLKYQPKSVLYFDTLSSWPALMYKKLKEDAVKLMVHYHEYLSPDEYAQNMRLVTSLHHQETEMYQRSFSWISQTNEVRLKKMIHDNNLENMPRDIFHTMPNYPSKQWATVKTDFGTSGKVKLVYVGALGFDSMYLQEAADWVIKNKNLCTLDLYSYNIDEKANEFLRSIQDNNVWFHGGVNYKELPVILKEYDVGLVLYKPVSVNWVENAPNKIFEYLACGLDVWFSKTMKYSLRLARENTLPKIIPVDFENLNQFDFQKAVSKDGLIREETNYFYEDVYGDILKTLTE